MERFIVRQSDVMRWGQDFAQEFRQTARYLGFRKTCPILMYEINVPWRVVRIYPWLKNMNEHDVNPVVGFEARQEPSIELCYDSRQDHLAIFGLVVYLIRTVGVTEKLYYERWLQYILRRRKISTHALFDANVITVRIMAWLLDT